MASYIVSCGCSLLNSYRSAWCAEPSSISDLVDYANEIAHKGVVAELMVLNRLSLTDRDQLNFVGPASSDDNLCISALTEYLEQKGSGQVYGYQVSGLTGVTEENRRAGLVRLVHLVMGLVRDAGSSLAALIVADGGKAQIAYVTLAGILLGIPVLYFDEGCAGLIELPTLPLGFDYSLFEDYRDKIEALLEVSDRQALTTCLATLPESLHVLFSWEKKHGKIYMSPTGDALISAYQMRRSPEVLLENVKSHHTLFGPGGMKTLSTVPSTEFRRLCKMLMRLYPPIISFVFDAMEKGRSLESSAEYLDKGPGWVKYKFCLAEGCQIMKVLVPKGTEKQARFALGSRIFL